MYEHDFSSLHVFVSIYYIHGNKSFYTLTHWASLSGKTVKSNCKPIVNPEMVSLCLMTSFGHAYFIYGYCIKFNFRGKANNSNSSQPWNNVCPISPVKMSWCKSPMLQFRFWFIFFLIIVVGRQPSTYLILDQKFSGQSHPKKSRLEKSAESYT